MTERDRQVRKMVDKFVRGFNEFNDTAMLCIYKINKKDDAVSFAGNIEDMVRPLSSILEKAYETDEQNGLTHLMASIICAFNRVVNINEDEEMAKFYRKVLQEVIDNKFVVEDEEEEVEEEHEETFEELKEKLNKMGYNVSKKPTNNPKSNAKTKK